MHGVHPPSQHFQVQWGKERPYIWLGILTKQSTDSVSNPPGLAATLDLGPISSLYAFSSTTQMVGRDKLTILHFSPSLSPKPPCPFAEFQMESHLSPIVTHILRTNVLDFLLGFLVPSRGRPYLLTYCVLLGQPPENAGEEHVTERCRDKHNESIFVDGWKEKGGWTPPSPLGRKGGCVPFPCPSPLPCLAPTEVLGGRDVGEHEQREVLHHVETEVEAAEKAVTRTRRCTAEVVVPIGEGHQEAGCRVQTNAEAPHVALGNLPTNGGAH